MGSTTFSQQQRFLTIQTPLGDDEVLLRSFSGSEGISQLFHFRLDLLSENRSIDFDDIVGQNVTWRARLAGDRSERCFNGHVSGFAQMPDEGRLARYEAEIVPWLWFLTRTADCRIYQNKTVPEIIEDVFHRFGLQNFSNQLSGSYRQRDYCVQYRETAFNFLVRLMEQEGIFYFFRHEDGRHTLVLGDRTSVHQACPNQETARYEPAGGEGFNRPEDYVTEWRIEHQLRPGRYSSADFNFENPRTRLGSSVQSNIDQGGNRNYELYDYPGEYENRDEAETEARVRMEAEETPHICINGASNCRAFTAGARFELQDHPRRNQNAEYVLASVMHCARAGGFYSGVGGEEPGSYQNSFTAIPRDVVFRPPRRTPKPLVQGAQTAFVVGPSGEETYCDRYGRVKVQFHWDRVGQRNEQSSCWIRVSQAWAGNRWGSMWIPRIGQEVIVDFLEGDPDRPIITGCVYNAAAMPPYNLPDEKTKSTFKSNSSKGGGGFNELRFEDKKGHEQVFIHAQGRMDQRVRGNSYETVEGERHLVVGQNQVEWVKGSKETHLIDGNFEFSSRAPALWQSDESLNYLSVTHHRIRSHETFTAFSDRRADVLSLEKVRLVGPGGSIIIDESGVTIQGDVVKINCGPGDLTHWWTIEDVQEWRYATEADSGRAGEDLEQASTSSSERSTSRSRRGEAHQRAAQNGTPFTPAASAGGSMEQTGGGAALGPGGEGTGSYDVSSGEESASAGAGSSPPLSGLLATEGSAGGQVGTETAQSSRTEYSAGGGVAAGEPTKASPAGTQGAITGTKD